MGLFLTTPLSFKNPHSVFVRETSSLSVVVPFSHLAEVLPASPWLPERQPAWVQCLLGSGSRRRSAGGACRAKAGDVGKYQDSVKRLLLQ